MEERRARVAIIGGSSLLEAAQSQHHEQQTVETSQGAVVVTWLRSDVVLVQRHKSSPQQTYELPHAVRHGAIAAALQLLHVRTVFAFCSVGSLHSNLLPGTLCVPDDYFNVWGVHSALHDERAHISPHYDSEARNTLIAVLQQLQNNEQTTTTTSTSTSSHSLVTSDCVYVQTRGPRFETKAEVRWLAQAGHVVGMTGADEATHMQELGLPYACIAVVDNYANGVKGADISLEAFRALVKKNEHTVITLLNLLLDKVSQKK